MKYRNLIYFLSFLILIVLFARVVLLNDPVARMEKRILLGEEEQVDRILIHSAHDSVLLRYSGEEWTLASGERASEVAVENVLWAARSLQLEGMLPEDEGRETGMPVSVFFYAGEKELLSYDLAPQRGGLRVRPRGRTEVYKASLPGYGDLDLGRVFSTSLNHYLERMLIDLKPSEICMVEVEGRDRETYRFTMDSTGTFDCILPGSGRPVDRDSLDELSIRLLFSYFTAIRYEDRLSEGAVQLQEEKRWLGTLRVEAFSGEEHELRVYSMPDESGGGSHMFTALVIHNGEPGVLLVKYLYLDVLMRDKSRFFKGSV